MHRRTGLHSPLVVSKVVSAVPRFFNAPQRPRYCSPSLYPRRGPHKYTTALYTCHVVDDTRHCTPRARPRSTAASTRRLLPASIINASGTSDTCPTSRLQHVLLHCSAISYTVRPDYVCFVKSVPYQYQHRQCHFTMQRVNHPLSPISRHASLMGCPQVLGSLTSNTGHSNCMEMPTEDVRISAASSAKSWHGKTGVATERGQHETHGLICSPFPQGSAQSNHTACISYHRLGLAIRHCHAGPKQPVQSSGCSPPSLSQPQVSPDTPTGSTCYTRHSNEGSPLNESSFHLDQINNPFVRLSPRMRGHLDTCPPQAAMSGR